MSPRTQISICSLLIVVAAIAAAAQIHHTRPLVASSGQQGYINTVVGGGPNNMPAVSANVNGPDYIAFDAQGNYYYAAYYQQRVFKVDTTGKLTVLAGNGFAGYSGDGGPAANATLYYPQGIAVDSANPANVYIADTNNCVIRQVNQSTGVIHTIAGGTDNTSNGCNYGGDGGAASAANLGYPIGLAVNPGNGDLYIADSNNGRIRKVAGGIATGTITTVAGGNATNGNCGGSLPYGDGGTATNATLCYPGAVALDTSVTPPNIFISNDTGYGYNQCTIREVVGSSGKIYRVAGQYYNSNTATGGCGYIDANSATNGQIYYPYQLQAQVNGNTTTVSVADYNNGRVRQVTLTYSNGVPQPGALTSFAGGSTTTGCAGFGDGGPASSACMNPVGLAFDGSGNMFVGDWQFNRVRKIAALSPNDISTVAGWGDPNTGATQPNYSDPLNNSNVPGSGVALFGPFGVAADANGNVYVSGDSDQSVQQYSQSSGNVNAFAGNGFAGFAGDGLQATDPTTELYYPTGTAKDSNGNTYIADYNNCIVRVVHADGTIHSFAGGTDGAQNGCGFSGDGGPASAAQLYQPWGVAVDANNNVYIADYDNQRIRKVDNSGIITTVAGNGTFGYGGDGGPATNAMLRYPIGVAVDRSGNLYIADFYNHRIREVNAATQVITTVAGNGGPGFSGDGIATQNNLNYPQGVAVDVNGNLFVADSSNNILRWVDPAGTMLTFAGTGAGYGFSGDGGPAVSALMATPTGVTQDAAGNFYAADQVNNRIREVTAFAGVGRSTNSLSYGITAVNTTNLNPGVVTLSAIGPTNISGITTTGDFNETDDCIGGLNAGQTCTVNVYFAPTASGARYGTLSITSNGLLAPLQTVALQGEGTALTVKGSPIAFGSSIINQSVSKTVTLTNAGTTAITINSMTLTQATDFTLGTASSSPCPSSGTLNGKASCNILVTFTPHSVGTKKGTLVVSTNDPASPLLIPMSGIGSSYEVFTPSSVTFTTTLLNTASKAVKVTFKYTGTGTLTLNSLTSNNAAFTLNTTGITSGACNLSGTTSLAQNTSCAFNVVFKPAVIGTTSSTVTASFTGDPAGVTSLNLPVSGLGTEVKLSSTSMNFGTVAYPNTKQLSVTVTNVGTTGLTFGNPSISGTGASAYSVVPYNGTASTCLQSALTLTQNAHCTITVQFTPPAGSGTSFPGSLNIVDNDPTSPQAVKLSGVN